MKSTGAKKQRQNKGEKKGERKNNKKKTNRKGGKLIKTQKKRGG
jgi:hypothetical protein